MRFLYVIFITVMCAVLPGVGFSQVIAFSENFESATLPGLPAGWTQTHAGGGNGWETHKGALIWNPDNVPGHTQYCVVDDAHHWNNSPAILTTPTFSLLGLTNPHVSFDVLYDQQLTEVAWIEISTDGGATFTSIDTLHPIDNRWGPGFADLSSVTPTATCQLRFCYTDGTGPGVFFYGEGTTGLAIDNIKVYQPSSHDLGLVYVCPDIATTESYGKIGDSITFQAIVGNYSAAAISSFSVSWQSSTGSSGSQTFVSPFAAFSNGGWWFYALDTAKYPVTVAGPQTVKVWVTSAGDTAHRNDTFTTTIVGVPAASWPLKKTMVEEETGTWCGWCPRGIVYMDSLWKLDSNIVSIVCVHDEALIDGMANDNSSTKKYDTVASKTTGFVFGYPDYILDRQLRDDPSFAFTDLPPFFNLFGFANMAITQTIAGSSLTAEVNVTPAINLSGQYQLELVVEENDVSSPTGNFWQSNEYSGLTTYVAAGCGYDFNDSGSTIAAGHIKFHFVARYTMPADLRASPNGVAGSLPSTMTAGATYNYTFAPVPLRPNWNPTQLRCIALLIDADSSSTNYGRILNSVYSIGTPWGVTGTATQTPASDIYIYPNPATREAHLTFSMAEQADATVTVYDALGRAVINIPAQQMDAGLHTINIATQNLSAGIYSVTLTAGGNRTTRLLSITR